MTIQELETSETKKVIYLGQWENYKAWQLIYIGDNFLKQGKVRFILDDGKKCKYASKKEIDNITNKFMSIISRIALLFSKNFSNITYTGKWNDSFVWELWNQTTPEENSETLPQFILFNGKKYKIVKDQSETLDILNYFL